MVVLPVMADINFNQNTFKRKRGKKPKRRKGFKVLAKYLKTNNNSRVENF